MPSAASRVLSGLVLVALVFVAIIGLDPATQCVFEKLISVGVAA